MSSIRTIRGRIGVRSTESTLLLGIHPACRACRGSVGSIYSAPSMFDLLARMSWHHCPPMMPEFSETVAVSGFNPPSVPNKCSPRRAGSCSLGSRPASESPEHSMVTIRARPHFGRYTKLPRSTSQSFARLVAILQTLERPPPRPSGESRDGIALELSSLFHGVRWLFPEYQPPFR